MPIHEVSSSLESKDEPVDSATMLTKAGQAVLSEYTLLNIFPRDIADAQLSGAIHIDNLGTWLLKPDEVSHDLRFFFQNGLKLDNPLQISMAPPRNFESALAVVFNVLLHANKETNRSQTCDYFNVFLAPFVKGVETEKIKDNLRLFVLNLNQHANATLGLELSIPNLISEKEAIGLQGKICGKYGDFTQESQLLASLLIEVFAEESSQKPLLNPNIVIKINKDTLTDEKAKAVLLKVHCLVAEKGTPYFANGLKKEAENAVFSGSGVKLSTDFTGDWETDTLRTGCLGCVTINLPRIAQECERDKNKFFDLVKERFSLLPELGNKKQCCQAIWKKFAAFSAKKREWRHIF